MFHHAKVSKLRNGHQCFCLSVFCCLVSIQKGCLSLQNTPLGYLYDCKRPVQAWKRKQTVGFRDVKFRLTSGPQNPVARGASSTGAVQAMWAQLKTIIAQVQLAQVQCTKTRGLQTLRSALSLRLFPASPGSEKRCRSCGETKRNANNQGQTSLLGTLLGAPGIATRIY